MFLSISIPGDELDRRMGGGLYLGQIVTILGGNGEGKTVVSLRLVYGLIKNGATIAYVSSQLPVREFVSECDSLGYPLFNEILSGIMHYIPAVFILRKSRKASLDDLLNNDTIKDKKVLVIDSMNRNIFRDFDAINYYMKLRKFSEGRLVIVTMNPEELGQDELMKISELSTTVIQLRSKELAGERKHSMELSKYPMVSKNFQQNIPFRIEPGRGFIVEITSVS
ncbi:flagellar accessory protein FlaH [Thermogymnomonas acidicola]|uniref:Flagellar accessory protein FlaH n=1 Tax=Thermogymnomonas acidicola TaxID=399579 RepID=A0AA37BRB5_9ARCH|nr:ATPase domain-containing protein [Thermogymnomonas acidicola]GGM73489.1 flagellar accessory protein FlaH [Thermogymnomonas acidicola]